ncbi:MAG: dihydrofolate reductase [Gammaproteobacteria bacterium]|nr:MAG: dihydrofolate reductase [Gammaproteobacteria bacterium]
MHVSIIVAMSENGVIGRNNRLPWYLPNDLKYFKRVTMGKPVIMGRKTYESIGKPLPGRMNLVITRDRTWHADGVSVCHTLESALEQAKAAAEITGEDEVMIMGGAQIYHQALPLATRFYLTRVHEEIEGDAFFDQVDWSNWREVAREDFVAEPPNSYDYSFIVLETDQCVGGKPALSE